MDNTLKRPIRSKAEREAFSRLSQEFWSKELERPVLGHWGEWMEKRDKQRRKLSIIAQAALNGTIDLDELLAKYDLAKFL